MPPTGVTLTYLFASASPASFLPVSSSFTGNTVIQDDQTVVLLNGRSYQFRGTTTGEDPDADWTFERRPSPTGASEQTTPYAGSSNDVLCDTSANSQDHSLTNIACSVYDGKSLCVTADNDHNEAAVHSCAVVEVIGKLVIHSTCHTHFRHPRYYVGPLTHYKIA